MKNPLAYRVFLVMSAVPALAGAIMWTVGTVYYVSAVGLDPFQLVLVGTVLEATAFIFEMPTGVVADVYGRRLSVIIGMFLLGAGFTLVGIVPAFAALLLAQVVTGIGYTFLSGATQAWLADEIGEEHVGTAMLRAGQLARIAGILGTIASVALASLALQLPFLVGGGLYILLGVFLALNMPETGFRPAPREQRNTPAAFRLGLHWQSMRRTLGEGIGVVRRSPTLLTLLAIGFFWGAASEGMDRLGDAHLLANFTFPALGSFQPVVWFGILGIVGSLVELAANETLRRRLERISRIPASTARALLVLNGLMIAGLIVFAAAGSFWLAIVAVLAYGVCRSMGGPLYDAWLVQHIDPPVRATVISMSGQADAIGQIAGGPGIGLIGARVSIRAAIVAAGLLLSPALALYARANRQSLDAAEEELTDRPLVAEGIEAT